MKILQKWADIKLPLKGLVDLLPANLLDNAFSPNLQNMELDEGVVRSRKGYTLNSQVDIEAYITGTVVTTQGSKVVTGIGTTWLSSHEDNSFTNLDASEKSYLIESVEGNTSLTLNDVFSGETTRKKLTEDANYAGTNTPTAMCWDGTNHWAIVKVAGVYKVRKYDAVMGTIADTVIRSPITIPTGITKLGDSIWVAGKDSDNQYLQNVTEENLANLPFAVGLASFIVYAKGYAYVARGAATNTFQRYNKNYNIWESLTDIPFIIGSYGTAASYDGGKYIYLNAANAPSGDQRYNIDTDTWETLSGGQSPLDAGSAYLDGYIYSGQNTNEKFYRRNVLLSSWEELQSLGVGKNYNFLCSDGESIYSLNHINLYKYDINANTWSNLGAHSLGNKTDIHYAAGYIYTRVVGTKWLKRYNITSGSWESMGDSIYDCLSYSTLCFDGVDTLFSILGDGSNEITKYSISGNSWNEDAISTFNMGVLLESDTPQIEDITELSGFLWSYAGFWDSETNSFNYNLIKHNIDLITFTKYESPTQVKETGLHNKGTNLVCNVREEYRGILYDFIYELTPVDGGNLMTVVGKYSTEVVHDGGLGTYVRGISYDGTVLWSCQSTDTTTVKFIKYLAAVSGDSYTIAGLTDNLFNYKKWDGSETMLWSTIPKGRVAYSFDTKEWIMLKAELNSNYHIGFMTFMNYLFACNGYDDAWCWDGVNKVTGAATANGLVTTMIASAFGEANDYWNGSVIVSTSGDNEGEAVKITDWDLASTTFTFATGFSNATQNLDTFYVVHVITDPNLITAGDITHDAAKTSMPKGKLLAVFQSRLWTNDKDHPNILRCSGIHLDTDSGMSDTWDALQQFQIANDDIITGLHTAGDRLYVFAERNTYVLMGSGGFSSYQLVKLDEPVGLLSDKGAAIKNNMAIFCGRGGIYQVIGREIKKLSDGIKNFFNTIQQTKVYWRTWIQSSEEEFENGSYNSDEIGVDNGVITLKTNIKVWSSLNSNWGEAVERHQVGTSQGVAILENSGNEGLFVDDSYLSGNIAGQLSVLNTSNFSSPRNTINGDYNSYAYGRSKVNGHKIFSISYKFTGVKNIRRIKLRFTTHNDKLWTWGTTLTVGYQKGDSTRVDIFTYYIHTRSGNVTLNPYIEYVFGVDGIDLDRLYVKWESDGSEMAVSFTEMEVFEWITKSHYVPTKRLYSTGYIVFKEDSGIVNPLWGKVAVNYLQTFPDYNMPFVSLSARTSPDGTTWDDNSWVTFGEVINNVGVLKNKEGIPDLPRQRYIQVKVDLMTYLPWCLEESAVINQLTLSRSNTTSGTYTSEAKLLSLKISAWDVFDTKQSIPEGSALKFEVTSAEALGSLGGSGDKAWKEIVPGNKPQGYINSSGATWFQWRVTVMTTTIKSPEVNAGYIWWIEGGEQLTPMCSIMHNDRYYLSVATLRLDGTSSKINNEVLVINKVGNFEKIKGLKVSGFTIFKDRLYAGASDSGFIYLLEEGYSDNTKEIEAYVETVDYTFNYEFRKNLSNHYKNLFQIYCEGRVSTDNLFVGYSFDGGQTWEDIEIVMSTLKVHEAAGNLFKVLKYLPFGRQGKIIRFRVKANTLTDSVEVHSLRAFLKISPITGS